MALAVRQGKIAAFLMDEPMARVLCAQSAGVTYLKDYLTQTATPLPFPKRRRARFCGTR